jgi:hypothetical protein
MEILMCLPVCEVLRVRQNWYFQWIEYDIVIKMFYKIGEKVLKIQFFWQKVLF